MNKNEILSHVDHTLLKPISTMDEIKQICDDAIKYHTASVCIPPSFVERVHKLYPELNICTVIGFPLGYNTLETKLFETKNAIENGANEIDMVINLGDVKDKNYEQVTNEIKTLKSAVGNKILKVIIETCYLTEDEKIALCKCVSDAKADYIKTSTGFGSAGATIEDIKLFKEHINPNVKMKAAGGIRTVEDMVMYLNKGTDRLGCSAAVKLLKDETD